MPGCLGHLAALGALLLFCRCFFAVLTLSHCFGCVAELNCSHMISFGEFLLEDIHFPLAIDVSMSGEANKNFQLLLSFLTFHRCQNIFIRHASPNFECQKCEF